MVDLGETMKSPLRQWRERIQLQLRCMVGRTEYHLYRFGDRGKDYDQMLNFMTLIALRSYALPVLNDLRWLPVLLNKWLLHLHFTQFGIPLPEVYGVYEPGTGFARSGGRLASRDDLRAFLMQVRPASLVVKPVGGMRGQRVLILNRISYDGDQINAST